MKRIDNNKKTCWYNFQRFYFDDQRMCWDMSYFNNMGLPGAFFDMTPEEFELLKGDIEFKEIYDADTVLITKNTKFPKLFIGESGVPIKRTIVAKNASKIIVPNSAKRIFQEAKKNGEMVYAIHSSFGEWFYTPCSHLQEVGKTIEDLYNEYLNYFWPGRYEEPILCYYLPRDIKPEYLCTDKLALFDSLYRYLNSKMTKVTPEMRTNIIGMIRSKDQLQMKLAIDMLKTMDLSGILFDVYWALTTPHNSYASSTYSSLPDSVKNSINFQYIKACIGCSGRDLNSSYNSAIRDTIISMIKHDLLNEEEIFRVRVGFQILCYRDIDAELTDYYKSILEDVGLPESIDDTDGKATTCYRELAD